MHGFNQGQPTIQELINNFQPQVLMVEEHWLTEANLNKFDVFKDYFNFGCSAMSKTVETGILRGRPFGGVLTMIHNSLRKITETIFCSERFAIIKIANIIIVNIYLPCVGTDNRLLICEDLFADILAWRNQFPSCEWLIAGDFNVNLDNNDNVATFINSFASDQCLTRCDVMFNKVGIVTYSNSALNHNSCIDYFLTSSTDCVLNYDIIDPAINFSDHLPVMAVCEIILPIGLNGNDAANKPPAAAARPIQYRWDHADLVAYYQHTGYWLGPILDALDKVVIQFNNHEAVDFGAVIDSLYNDVVVILTTGANNFVPQYRKNFFKFWWDEELNILKSDSIESDKLWKSVGKPRQGPVFEKRQSCRLNYRKRLRDSQKAETVSYTNDLHDCLMEKNGPAFWKCWNSKFESHSKCVQVDGCVDGDTIASKFAQHFAEAYTSSNTSRTDTVKAEYLHMRQDYAGFPANEENQFDAELTGNIISGLKRGKAMGLDGLTAEHLQYSHPILSVILAKLFNLMLLCNHVPESFGISYTIPLSKVKDCRTKSMTTDDFRGIAISCILSKVFEHCVLNRYRNFLTTGDNQFGFKKGLGCSDAIYSARKIIEQYVNEGCTVNLCAIDLTKAYDKTNHHALFIKLMKRNVPVMLLATLESWLGNCWTCVRWGSNVSEFFQIGFGVRQGSVLSPFLFAVYIDDIICHFSLDYAFHVVLYADDILIIAPSVYELQRALNICEIELNWLDMNINVKKCACLRIGPRCNIKCADIFTSSGNILPWVSEIRYLGIYIMQSRNFKCSLEHAKKSCYRALNAVFGKIGRLASEEVVLDIVSKKCLPVLLYGLEAVPLTKSDKSSLDFITNRFLMKLFKTGNINVVKECQDFFGFVSPSVLLERRTFKFENRHKLV